MRKFNDAAVGATGLREVSSVHEEARRERVLL